MAPASKKSPASSSRWSEKHNKELYDFFASNTINPQRQDNDYIDSFWGGLDEESKLRCISLDRFRHHYKEKAHKYMTEQALTGVRRSECFG